MVPEKEPEAFLVLGHMWLISPLLFDSNLLGAAFDIVSQGNQVICFNNLIVYFGLY